MPAEGGDGTRLFLQRVGPLIDFVLGVAYFRVSTGAKTKNKTTPFFALLRHTINALKNHLQFTKTGSGQTNTSGKAEKREAFVFPQGSTSERCKRAASRLPDSARRQVRRKRGTFCPF